MFFIFGWGRTSNNDFGPTRYTKCRNCNNESFWHLMHRRVWFTLFFIPVFPYESDHYLLCRICTQGFKLSSDEIQKYIELNGLTRSLMAEEMTPEEYGSQVEKRKLLGHTNS